MKISTEAHHALEKEMRDDYISTLPEHPVYPRELLDERKAAFEKIFKDFLDQHNLEI